MQPTISTQIQPSAATILATFPLPSTARNKVAEQIQVNQGQQIFNEQNLGVQSYLVTSGEVLILRRGRAIDLVEAGELLESELWPGAIAVALTDCTLETLVHAIPTVQPC